MNSLLAYAVVPIKNKIVCICPTYKLTKMNLKNSISGKNDPYTHRSPVFFHSTFFHTIKTPPFDWGPVPILERLQTTVPDSNDTGFTAASVFHKWTISQAAIKLLKFHCMYTMYGWTWNIVSSQKKNTVEMITMFNTHTKKKVMRKYLRQFNVFIGQMFADSDS